MKNNAISILITLLLLFNVVQAQTFTLSVNNGYGAGSYQAGDSVHIWSIEYDSSKYFSEWTGDVQYLLNPHEWHTILIMPNHNISVSAEIRNMPQYKIHYERMMGQVNFKNVYYFFPSGLKGVIYVFHGTGGNAVNWIENTEGRSFLNAAIANNFGIIITEAEEITLNDDITGDGKLRWQTFPIDTINGIDYLNIKVITNVFIERGDFTNSTPKFSVGMSNGGSFSAAISYIYNYKAGISYCASSAESIFSTRNNPFAFRMALYDNNEEVGAEGNYQAWINDSLLSERGICHDYKIHDRQPLFPERFARIKGISVNISRSIFNDLVSNNQLDNFNFALSSEIIATNVLNNSSLFPNITGLSKSSQIDVLNQISVSNAEHKFYSDYNFETLSFFNDLCGNPTGINEITNSSDEIDEISIFPNPTITEMKINLKEDNYQISIYNVLGQRLLYIGQSGYSTTVDVRNFAKGIYIIRALNKNKILTSKFIKQ